MLARLCSVIAKTFFREIVIEGEENLSVAGPLIITPNHPNELLDPMLIYLLSLSTPFHFVAKASLFQYPVLGRILRMVRAIPVVRRLDAEGEVDYRTFFAACLGVLASGESIVIFPEGRSWPESMMAPLRTGAARLSFMAREEGVEPTLLPIGLNYERGQVFRSSVLISIAPPIDTTGFVKQHAVDPVAAVKEMTAEINRCLAEHVLQTETYRDRELMLLLERIYAEGDRDDSWSQRWSRLKEFESGLAKVRETHAVEINQLRRRLARYERLTSVFGIRDSRADRPQSRPWSGDLAEGTGLMVAGVGVLLNWIPYKLCATLVRWAKGDPSSAATRKIVFSLILFPVTYIIEGLLVALWLGRIAACAFAVAIIPLSYFTLLFIEWREELGSSPPAPFSWLQRRRSRRVTERLADLRQQVIADVDDLATLPELRSE